MPDRQQNNGDNDFDTNFGYGSGQRIGVFLVAAEQGKNSQGFGKSVPADTPEEFAASLKRRGQAAAGLERDLLTEVPLLYGSPGTMEPHGDPGILLARIHQEELQRRNGGGVPPFTTKRSDVSLPFEHVTVVLPFVILLLLILMD